MDRFIFNRYNNSDLHLKFDGKAIAYRLIDDKVYLMGYIMNGDKSEMKYHPIKRSDKTEIDGLLKKSLRREVSSIAVFCQD